MRLRSFLSLALSALGLAVGCRSAAPLPPGAAPYLPQPAHLAGEGVTAKYYSRYDRGSDREVNGQIEYVRWRRLPDGRLEHTMLSPALVPETRSVHAVDSLGLRTEAYERYRRDSSIVPHTASGYALHWDGSTSELTRDGANYAATITLSAAADTTWRGRPARQFRGRYVHRPEEGAPDTSALTRLYVEGLGRVYSEVASEGGTYTSELAAQLSPGELRSLRDAVPPRVAYIDSAQVLLHDPDFTWCRPQGPRTRDYYNAIPDVTILGGHSTLREVLLPRLDLAALAGESGYLTLRFVVNCRGEIGLITADEADLDFAPKAFPPEAVAAFAKTLLDAVRAGDLGFDVSDAGDHDYYAYLTLKLHEGEVTDFLP